MKNWIKKHWELLSYLIFGVLTTLLNILLYALFQGLFGYHAANSWGNVLDNALCILFAYATNRAFVFRSKTTGRAAAKEFAVFVGCRLGTLVLDAAIMMIGGNLLAAQGEALVMAVLNWLVSLWAGVSGADAFAYTTVTGGVSGEIGIIGGADGPTAVFVTVGGAQQLWGMCVKVFSNVVVVILNYVFSKLLVFKKKER